MKPRDFAIQIEPNALPARLHEIEQVLHKFAGQVLTDMAVEIDTSYFDNQISKPTQAARICRDKAAEHLHYT